MAAGDFHVRSAVPLSRPRHRRRRDFGWASIPEPRFPRCGPGCSEGVERHRRRSREILRPQSVTFGQWPADQPLYYNTEPFPQPGKSAGGGRADTDRHEPARPRHVAWEAGGKTYWLTQTVESGRLAHSFSFTLLGEDGGGVRLADLLADKSVEADASEARRAASRASSSAAICVPACRRPSTDQASCRLSRTVISCW